VSGVEEGWMMVASKSTRIRGEARKFYSLYEQHGKNRRADILDNDGLDNGIYRLLKTINTTQIYFTVL
jgi:hypothetical protein